MDTNVPHQGDRLTVAEDVPALGVTQWRAPFTGGFECVVPAGTVLLVLGAQAEAEAFPCRPEDYERLEQLLVPEEVRTSEKYDGYYLLFKKRDIGSTLQTIST